MPVFSQKNAPRVIPGGGVTASYISYFLLKSLKLNNKKLY